MFRDVLANCFHSRQRKVQLSFPVMYFLLILTSLKGSKNAFLNAWPFLCEVFLKVTDLLFLFCMLSTFISLLLTILLFKWKTVLTITGRLMHASPPDLTIIWCERKQNAEITGFSLHLHGLIMPTKVKMSTLKNVII